VRAGRHYTSLFFSKILGMCLIRTGDVTKVLLSGLVGKPSESINTQRSLYAEHAKNYLDNCTKFPTPRTKSPSSARMYVSKQSARRDNKTRSQPHATAAMSLRHLPYTGSHLLTTLSKTSRYCQDEFVTGNLNLQTWQSFILRLSLLA
jgi:hypothetical protein